VSSRSFRLLLLRGSLLWTLGVLVVSAIALVVFLRDNPGPHMAVLAVFLHVPSWVMVALGATCLTFGALDIRRSLAATAGLRNALASVHRGATSRLTGRYPSEVQPLVDDLNALLDERDERVRRAVAKAGDLAHGLKTPLAVLARDAERAAAAGQPELAASMTHEVERMRRQVDYHLAQARAAVGGASGGAACLVAPSVEALFRTLARLHGERVLAMEQSVPPGTSVRCSREDLEEMLGNVLDNACKWARSRVRVESVVDERSVTIAVDDDGSGLDPSLATTVLQRGVRADERVPGSGLGLAITREIVELYGGSIQVRRSAALGGLRVELRLGAPHRATA
jgi:signal transduction histidine kinase